jgi:hypothetical protein
VSRPTSSPPALTASAADRRIKDPHHPLVRNDETLSVFTSSGLAAFKYVLAVAGTDVHAGSRSRSCSHVH